MGDDILDFDDEEFGTKDIFQSDGDFIRSQVLKWASNMSTLGLLDLPVQQDLEALHTNRCSISNHAEGNLTQNFMGAISHASSGLEKVSIHQGVVLSSPLHANQLMGKALIRAAIFPNIPLVFWLEEVLVAVRSNIGKFIKLEPSWETNR